MRQYPNGIEKKLQTYPKKRKKKKTALWNWKFALDIFLCLVKFFLLLRLLFQNPKKLQKKKRFAWRDYKCPRFFPDPLHCSGQTSTHASDSSRPSAIIHFRQLKALGDSPTCHIRPLPSRSARRSEVRELGYSRPVPFFILLRSPVLVSDFSGSLLLLATI